MGRIRRLLALLLVLALPWAPARADLVVVANPRSGVERLTRDEVINIFLGRYRQLPGGVAAQPVDLTDANPDKGRFYLALVGKSLAEINAYWARLRFSGRTEPPRQAVTTESLLEQVASERGAIGYVERSRADGRVRIVMDFTP